MKNKHRSYLHRERSMRQLNDTARRLNILMNKIGVPERDKDLFLSWSLSCMWDTYKNERMNKRLLIENHINSLGICLPNGMVKKDYSTSFSLPLDEISNVRLEGAEELGLELHVIPEDNMCVVSGQPTQSGDFTLHLCYHTIEGEPESRLRLLIAFNPNPRDLWKNIPTDENIIFYKPDSETATLNPGRDADGNKKKEILAASQRGRSHAQEGRPRDDHFTLHHCDESDWYIMAVADGAGSAIYSREGSRIACETAVEQCRQRLASNPAFEKAICDFEADKDNNEKRTEVTRMMIDIIHTAAKKAHDTVKRKAEETEGGKLKDFSTTLMFAICKRFEFGWFISSFWVGDGAICLFDEKTKMSKLLGTPDEGEFSGQTRFLTMPEIFHDKDIVKKRFRISFVPDFTALLLMTDGVSDAMFETDNNLNDYEKWEEFYNNLKKGFPKDEISGVDFSADDEKKKEQLLSWLDFWSPGNHDDRTLAILY